MGLFTDVVALFAAGYGWVFVTLLIAYELFAPTLIDKDTALSPLVRDLPKKLDDVDEKQDEIIDDVTDLKHQQKTQMQVQRASARANPQMDAEAVDRYLLQNGVEPNEFLKGNEMAGYANWDGSPDDTDGSSPRPEDFVDDGGDKE